MRAPEVLLALLAGATLLGGCSSGGDDAAQEKSNAEQLVKQTQAAGVAPGLTVSAAQALYGTDAPALCGALEDGLSPSELLLLVGNLAGRRPKLISTDAVTYAGIVVSIYCPDESDTFDDLVADIDSTDKS